MEIFWFISKNFSSYNCWYEFAQYIQQIIIKFYGLYSFQNDYLPHTVFEPDTFEIMQIQMPKEYIITNLKAYPDVLLLPWTVHMPVGSVCICIWRIQLRTECCLWRCPGTPIHPWIRRRVSRCAGPLPCDGIARPLSPTEEQTETDTSFEKKMMIFTDIFTYEIVF